MSAEVLERAGADLAAALGQACLREVRLPERFDALRFLDSRVWGVYRDGLDVPAVASIGLPSG